MLDVSRRFHLALSDLGRRSGLMAAAALLVAVGAGFLLAAFWSALAHALHWGPVWASVVVGLLCLAVALGLLFAAREARHAMPTAGDVQAEMEARAKLAAEAAIAAAKLKATQATASAGQQLHGLWDRARYRADRAAEDLDSTVERMAHAAMGNQSDPDAPPRRAAPAVALAGAFAVGIALAHALRRGRGGDE